MDTNTNMIPEMESPALEKSSANSSKEVSPLKGILIGGLTIAVFAGIGGFLYLNGTGNEITQKDMASISSENSTVDPLTQMITLGLEKQKESKGGDNFKASIVSSSSTETTRSSGEMPPPYPSSSGEIVRSSAEITRTPLAHYDGVIPEKTRQCMDSGVMTSSGTGVLFTPYKDINFADLNLSPDEFQQELTVFLDVVGHAHGLRNEWGQWRLSGPSELQWRWSPENKSYVFYSNPEDEIFWKCFFAKETKMLSTLFPPEQTVSTAGEVSFAFSPRYSRNSMNFSSEDVVHVYPGGNEIYSQKVRIGYLYIEATENGMLSNPLPLTVLPMNGGNAGDISNVYINGQNVKAPNTNFTGDPFTSLLSSSQSAIGWTVLKGVNVFPVDIEISGNALPGATYQVVLDPKGAYYRSDSGKKGVFPLQGSLFPKEGVLLSPAAPVNAPLVKILEPQTPPPISENTLGFEWFPGVGTVYPNTKDAKLGSLILKNYASEPVKISHLPLSLSRLTDPLVRIDPLAGTIVTSSEVQNIRVFENYHGNLIGSAVELNAPSPSESWGFSLQEFTIGAGESLELVFVGDAIEQVEIGGDYKISIPDNQKILAEGVFSQVPFSIVADGDILSYAWIGFHLSSTNVIPTIAPAPICSNEYAPMCGQPPMPICPEGLSCPAVMPEPQTYTNGCFLREANATFLSQGECPITIIATSAPIPTSAPTPYENEAIQMPTIELVPGEIESPIPLPTIMMATAPPIPYENEAVMAPVPSF